MKRLCHTILNWITFGLYYNHIFTKALRKQMLTFPIEDNLYYEKPIMNILIKKEWGNNDTTKPNI